MRRREFMTLLGGATAAWPLVTRAQQPGPMRRIGVLMNRTADDSEGRTRLAAFQQALHQLGWTEGGNVRIDIRWGADDADLERRYASELVALAPDIVFASGTQSVTALQHLSRTLPIVFAAVTDPVGYHTRTSNPHSSASGTTRCRALRVCSRTCSRAAKSCRHGGRSALSPLARTAVLSRRRDGSRRLCGQKH